MVRRRWHSPVTTLPRYERLLKGVSGLGAGVRTAELQEFAGLFSDLNGTVGALFMLEALGRVYPVRGVRRQYVWHPGQRVGERPARLPPLLPYVRIPRLLQHFGRTPIGTAALMRDVHFAGDRYEKHGHRERLLGALKMLAVLGIAAYDGEESGWFFAQAEVGRPYVIGTFGLESHDVAAVPFDENVQGHSSGGVRSRS